MQQPMHSDFCGINLRSESSLTLLDLLFTYNSSVVECLTRDQRAASLSLTGVTALWSLLVQPRKTCPYITEKFLMGHKESNQTIKTRIQQERVYRVKSK